MTPELERSENTDCIKTEYYLLLVYLLLFFLLLLLFTVPLLTPDEDRGSKALVFFIVFMCRRIGE